MDEENERQYMQFRYDERELQLGMDELLEVSVDVIVSPASRDLSHDRALAGLILEAAGTEAMAESRQLIEEYGSIDCGMAVYTGAGRLPCKAIIHAVGPEDGDEESQRRIEQAISRSLLLCEANDWKSIAFPAIGTDSDDTIATSARAFFRAITSFWDARADCAVEKIVLCLNEAQFRPFFDAFREDAMRLPAAPASIREDDAEPPVGVIDLSESDIAGLEDEEILYWFK